MKIIPGNTSHLQGAIVRHRRSDIVAGALDLLAQVGLPELTMRRLGTELDVRASAIYHHFPNKQALLGAVADEIINRGWRPALPGGAWDDQVSQVCTSVRRSVLAYQDGADLVATMWAFGLGGRAPYEALVPLLERAGLAEDLASTAARTLLHFVYGHAIDEQALSQAARIGAIDAEPRTDDDFANGLALVVAGIRERVTD